MGQIFDTETIGGTGHGKIWYSNVIGWEGEGITVSLSSKKTKVGQTITATISIPGAGVTPLTFSLVSATDRQSAVRSDSGAVKINGADITAAAVSTDATGTAVVQITDPEGIGVKTTLKVSAGSAEAEAEFDVTFTVITSPDVSEANMWGHMDETITSNGWSFMRPMLFAEATNLENTTTQVFGNESFLGAFKSTAITEGYVPLSSAWNEFVGNNGGTKPDLESHGWPVLQNGTPWSAWTSSDTGDSGTGIYVQLHDLIIDTTVETHYFAVIRQSPS